MDVSESTCVAAQEPGAPDSEPVQLELPAIPCRRTPQRPLPRHKRIYPPVHLMADIATTGRFCYLGDHPPEPVLCTYDDNGYHVSTDAEIFAKAHALLKVRFRRGIPILNYPDLLHSFLRTKIGGQQCSVFLCIFLDRAGQLIQIAELFRGSNDRATLYPKEITRAALACNAEQVLCAHTNSSGSSEPTQDHIGVARWLQKLFETMEMTLVDYLVVGDTITSLKSKGFLKQ